MDSNIPVQFPPELVSVVKKELKLNHEVSALKALVGEKTERIHQVQESITLKERIGIAKSAFYQKRDYIQKLKDSAEQDSVAINEKIKEWRDLRTAIFQNLESLLTEQSQPFRLAKSQATLFLEMKNTVDLLCQQLVEIINGLTKGQATLDYCYIPEVQSYSKQAQDLVDAIANVGYRADETTLKLASILERYHEIVNNTFLSDMRELRCASMLTLGDMITSLRVLHIDQANHRIGELVARCEHVLKIEVPIIKEQTQLAANEHVDGIKKHIEQQWERIRQKIWKDLHYTHSPFKPRPGQNNDSGTSQSQPTLANMVTQPPFKVKKEQPAETPTPKQVPSKSSSEQTSPPKGLELPPKSNMVTQPPFGIKKEQTAGTQSTHKTPNPEQQPPNKGLALPPKSSMVTQPPFASAPKPPQQAPKKDTAKKETSEENPKTSEKEEGAQEVPKPFFKPKPPPPAFFDTPINETPAPFPKDMETQKTNESEEASKSDDGSAPKKKLSLPKNPKPKQPGTFQSKPLNKQDDSPKKNLKLRRS